MDVASRKRELREQLVARRRAAPPSDRNAERAAARVIQLGEFVSARAIALYVALSDELSTLPIYAAAVAADKRVVLPRTRSDGRLEFAWTSSFEDLSPGRYGVLEPPKGSVLASLSEVDLVVVPGVAFDRKGARLGRGAGYYDRALAAQAGGNPFRLGFAESVQIVDEVPTEEFDERMDAVATERELLRSS